MTSTTTSAVTTVINEATKQYNTNGFGSGASGYLIIIITIIAIFGVIWYVKYSQNMMRESINSLNIQNESKHKENIELQNKLIELFKSSLNKQSESLNTINKQMIVELKAISEEVRNGVNYINSKTVELNEKFICTLNEDKEISIKDFEKQVKILNELSYYHFKEALDTRLERNNLVENQALIQEEIIEIAERITNEFKDSVSLIKFDNDNIKNKLFAKYDEILNQTKSEVCVVFKVSEGYLKSQIFRSIRTEVYRGINKMAKVNFDNL